MEKKNKNWKNVFVSVLYILFCAVIGLVGGYFLASYVGNITFWDVVYTLVIIVISFPLHVILHELGHLLGGLISGYEFIMFRLLNTVWIKTEAGLSKREEYIPGVLGQALMVPPETKEGEAPPFFLYHASGIVMNIVIGLFFILLGRSFSIEWLTYFFNVSSMVAFFLAITNTLPFKGTDGYNILKHFRQEETSSEIINLLYMYRDMVKGASLESLQKYVDLDSFDSFKNPNAATIYSLRATYLFERKDAAGAREIYQTLYENFDDLFEGHRPVIKLNYLFALLLTDSHHPDIPKIIESKTYQKFKQVKQSDYIRYQAAVELYFKNDLEKAEKLLIEGEKYIHLAPTLTDENFEKTMYQYIKEDLDKLREEK